MAGHDGVVFEILVSRMCSTYRNMRETHVSYYCTFGTEYIPHQLILKFRRGFKLRRPRRTNNAD